MPKKVLFHRNYQGFAGGHLKVFDYFEHTLAADGYCAEIYITPESRPDHLWRGLPVAAQYRPETADALFVAGLDWQALEAYPGIEHKVPVINLIQHVKHASPKQQLFHFLKRRATRVCVSEEVADRLRASGACNGPVYAIPNGIDHTCLPRLDETPRFDVLVCGIKNRSLATTVAERLGHHGFSVDCITELIARPDFLVRMAGARLTVLLPHVEEGFYLPALEAMAMGCVVICPDCIGNRSFCIDEYTALVPSYDATSIVKAVMRADQSPALAAALRGSALSLSKRFDIAIEREDFHRLLRQVI
jgi:hypothetical protein